MMPADHQTPNLNKQMNQHRESADMEPTSDVERTSPPQLRRSTDDRMLAGVCAGIARYAGVDPTLVRIAAVVGLVLGFGTIGLVYLLLWAIVPEDI
jgi:phage shock protein C